MIGLIGAVVIGGVLGWVAERYRWTRLGLVPAMTTAIGGAIVAYLVLLFFGIGLYGRGFTAAAGAIVVLILAPRVRRR
ncbi:MAG: hypothetical protein AAGK00_11070 [Pseudomonadota bacterium]